MKNIFTMVLASSLLVVTACSSHHKEKKEAEPQVSAINGPVTQEALTASIESWPESSKSAVNTLTSKYGLPNAVTDETVVWNNTAPFKRSIVYKEEVTHSFPMQHKDVLMQTVDYRVPLDKVASLSKFDGSLIVDRTKGELSARNEKEEMNILALNLSDKIIRGELTVEQARREYSKNAESFQAGVTDPMVSTLNFKTEGNTSDPDTMMQSQESAPTQMKTYESKEVEEVQTTIEED